MDSVAPRDRYAFKEDQEEKTESTDRVRVEDLEHVHPALSNARDSHKVADEADDGDENFFSSSEKLRPFVNHRRNETFHGTELRIETDKQQHEEEQTSPKWRARKLKHSRGISQKSKTRT